MPNITSTESTQLSVPHRTVIVFSSLFASHSNACVLFFESISSFGTAVNRYSEHTTRTPRGKLYPCVYQAPWHSAPFRPVLYPSPRWPQQLQKARHLHPLQHRRRRKVDKSVSMSVSARPACRAVRILFPWVIVDARQPRGRVWQSNWPKLIHRPFSLSRS